MIGTDTTGAVPGLAGQPVTACALAQVLLGVAASANLERGPSGPLGLYVYAPPLIVVVHHGKRVPTPVLSWVRQLAGTSWPTQRSLALLRLLTAVRRSAPLSPNPAGPGAVRR